MTTIRSAFENIPISGARASIASLSATRSRRLKTSSSASSAQLGFSGTPPRQKDQARGGAGKSELRGLPEQAEKPGGGFSRENSQRPVGQREENRKGGEDGKGQAEAEGRAENGFAENKKQGGAREEPEAA